MATHASSYKMGTVVLEGHCVAAVTTQIQMNEYNQKVNWNTVLSVATALQVSSSSANDTSAGTGARTVEIIGMGANYVPLTEIVVLNGQTQVATAGLFLKVFEANVLTVGALGSNDGDIYVIVTGTGGVITTGIPGTLTSALVKIPVGWVCSTSGMLVVGLNQTGRPIRLTAAAVAQGAFVQIIQQNLINVLDPRNIIFNKLVPANTAIDLDISDYVNKFNSLSQIELCIQALASGANVNAKLITKVV